MDTTFVNAVTVSEAAWFNDLNDFFYTVFSGAAGGGISGASITLTGLTLTGALTVGGNVVLGDASGDTLTIAPNVVTWSNNPTHSGNHTWSGNHVFSGVTSGTGTTRWIGGSATGLFINTPVGEAIRLGIGNADKMFVASYGASIGGSTNRVTTDPTNSLNLFNGTAPAGTLTNGITLYSAAGKLWAMDAAGAATQLTP